MKKKILVGIFLTYGLSSFGQTNLLTDGGFESAFTAPNTTYPQIFATDQWSGYFGTASTDAPYEGTKALKLTSTSDQIFATALGMTGLVVPGAAVCTYSGYIDNPSSITLSFKKKYTRMGTDVAAVLVYVYDTLEAGYNDDVLLYWGAPGFNSTTTEWGNVDVTMTAVSGATGEANAVEIAAYSSYTSAQQPSTMTDGSTLYLDAFVLSYTSSAGIVEVLDLNQNVYPNPASDVLTIEMVTDMESVSIVSVDGKSILNFDVNATSTKMDVSNLNSGVYFYNVKLKNGMILSNSFIKD